MGSTNVELEKFNGKGDFSLWRRKMRAILVQHKCTRALGGEKDLPEKLSQEEKEDMMELTYSTIILNLADNVLRKVDKEDTAAKVWLKLESLYMTKSVLGIAFIKEQLFSFKMDQGKSLDDNLEVFERLVTDDLTNAEENVKNAIKYGRKLICLEDVISALRIRELEIKVERKKNSTIAEGLNVQFKNQKKFCKKRLKDIKEGKEKPATTNFIEQDENAVLTIQRDRYWIHLVHFI
ncbi:hypothetical protein UlMin_035306 [Ulmus minor]